MGEMIMKKFLYILAFVGLLFFCLRFYFISTNNAQFKIFYNLYEEKWVYKILGLVPENVKKHFVTKKIDSFNGKDLLSLSDTFLLQNFDYILIRNNQSTCILKGFPISLVNETEVDSLDFGSMLPYMINLERFNSYIQEKGIKNEQEVIRRYCYFLSDLDDPQSYRIVEEEEDVKNLINDIPTRNFQTLKQLGYELIEPERLPLESKHTFCWFYNKGLIRFIFTFNSDGILKKVESKSIGYLGNEIPVHP